MGGIKYPFASELRARINDNLAAHTPALIDPGPHRHAAVGVVLLADTREQACFVLTRRRSTLRRHAGQWSLPGGRLDPGESAADAARREIAEEVGLTLPPDAILGRLDDFLSRSGHVISPFVLWSGHTAQLTVSPDEVDAAFRVPLEDLDRPDNPRREPLLHFALLNSTVFAPTAAILYQFREVALHSRHVRVVDVEQPFFAWR